MMYGSELLETSEDVRVEVLKSFGRTPESVRQDVENMKEWFKKQPHLPETPSDDVIEKYLIITKFRTETTKMKLDYYYSARQIVPELFDMDPNGPEIQRSMDVVYHFPLPKLTKDKTRIVFIKLKDPNPDNFDAVAYSAYAYALYEVIMREECRLGQILIFDLAGLKLAHLAKYTPSFLKRSDFVFKKFMVAKLSGLHFINAPSLFDTFLSVVKALFSKKIAERIHVHRTADSLYKLVDKEVLPKEYGGEGISLDELKEKWKQKFLEYDGLFKHLRSLKVDEELRPGGKSKDQELLGVQGNFRQLDVD